MLGVVAVAVSVVWGAATPALAHSSWTDGAPLPCQVLLVGAAPVGPRAVVAHFDGELVEATSSLSLVASDGTVLGLGGVDPVDQSGRTMALDLGERLAPGHYRVLWLAASAADGDVLEGQYGFSVGPAPAPDCALVTQEREGEGTSPLLLMGAGASAGAVIGGIGWWWSRRGR